MYSGNRLHDELTEKLMLDKLLVCMRVHNAIVFDAMGFYKIFHPCQEVRPSSNNEVEEPGAEKRENSMNYGKSIYKKRAIYR